MPTVVNVSVERRVGGVKIRTEMHGPYRTKAERETGKEYPYPSSDAVASVSCVDDNLGASVGPEPRDAI